MFKLSSVGNYPYLPRFQLFGFWLGVPLDVSLILAALIRIARSAEFCNLSIGISRGGLGGFCDPKRFNSPMLFPRH